MASLAEAFPHESPTIVHQLVHWAGQRGDAPCVHSGDHGISLTYTAFDALTNQLANALSQRGVGRGDRVMFFSGNAFLAALQMVAVWKCTAVYCPVNTALPADMLGYVLRDLDPTLVACDADTALLVERVSGENDVKPHLLVCCDSLGLSGPDARDRLSLPESMDVLDSLDAYPDVAQAPLPRAVDVASVIYTSGTTSHPKGVIQSHSWLHALCASQSAWTSTDDVIHCDLPMHHIGGAFSLFARGLWAGASIALWNRFSAGGYWERIAHYNASTALLLDVMTDWLLEQPETEGEHHNSLCKVHLQPLTDKHRALALRYGIDLVLTGYGSSEVGNAILGCIDEFPGGEGAANGSPNGLPNGLPNGTPPALWRGDTREVILSALRERHGEGVVVDGGLPFLDGLMGVPSGVYDVVLETDIPRPAADVPGRLRLTPAMEGVLFDGYLNGGREINTDGSYSTPDIASREASGRFYFHDRTQGMLRVRGENVSAAAVEQVFRSHRDVRHCVVLGLPAREGGEDDLVACLQPAASVVLTAAAMHEWCETRLPAYMRPRHYLFLDAMPLTSTLKLDRGALRSHALATLADYAS